jgi:hypothetical protein
MQMRVRGAEVDGWGLFFCADIPNESAGKTNKPRGGRARRAGQRSQWAVSGLPLRRSGLPRTARGAPPQHHPRNFHQGQPNPMTMMRLSTP